MRLQGFLYNEGVPEQVFYDRGDRQTYAPFPQLYHYLNNTLTRTIKGISQDSLL